MIPKRDPEPAAEADPYEAATDEAIALCDGDARAAVKALLITNAHLKRELELASVAVSTGYSRGWHKGRTRDAP